MIDNLWNDCETYELQRYIGTSLKQPANTFIAMLRVMNPLTLAKASGIQSLCDRPVANDDGEVTI
jgi:hypothetical protein